MLGPGSSDAARARRGCCPVQWAGPAPGLGPQGSCGEFIPAKGSRAKDSVLLRGSRERLPRRARLGCREAHPDSRLGVCLWPRGHGAWSQRLGGHWGLADAQHAQAPPPPALPRTLWEALRGGHRARFCRQEAAGVECGRRSLDLQPGAASAFIRSFPCEKERRVPPSRVHPESPARGRGASLYALLLFFVMCGPD